MLKWLEQLKGRWIIIQNLFRFLWKQRLWWLIPMVFVLLLFGLLFAIGLQTPLGPFIYTLI